MQRCKALYVVTILLGAGLLFMHCSEKSKVTPPPSTTVEMSGVLSLPAGTEVDPGDLSVGFGEADEAVDSAGGFTIKGTEHVPGLAMASDEDGIVMLMGVVPDPRANLQVELNVRATALALCFMNPFICDRDRVKASGRLVELDALPQLDTLEELLAAKLAADPNYLEKDDASVSGLIVRTINAYIDTHLPPGEGAAGRSKGVHAKIASESGNKSSIIVSPTTPKSGHQVTHAGNNLFKITNAYGRWAVLFVPQSNQKVWLPPNGSMLDFFWDGLPWAPSEREFTLQVDQPDDTLQVHVYGYGLKNEPDNRWDLLTPDEQHFADEAGLFTFIFELLGGAVDVITASASGISAAEGWEKSFDPVEHDLWVLDFLFSDAGDMANVHYLASEGRYAELSWFVFRKVFEKISMDESYRLKFEAVLGKTLSEKQLKRLDWFASQPMVYAVGGGIMIGEKVTNVMKTGYGFANARYKTTFKIWKSNEDFGGITGHVMQKESPFGPIQGANVHLDGDDNNPIPGHVTDVTTDADGGFMFQNVMAGAKTLTATKAGYNDKSVSVTVNKNQVANVTIELSKKTGSLSGYVVNEIFRRARKSLDPNHDTLFSEQLIVYARGKVAGEDVEESRFVSNGRIYFDLPVTSWWIVASHEDYYPDSLRITNVENQAVTLPRSLVMAPRCSVSATVTIIGGPSYQLPFDSANASQPLRDQGSNIIIFAGYTPGQVADEFDFWVNMNIVSGVDLYNVGTLYAVTNNAAGVAGFGVYGTNRRTCRLHGETGMMLYRVVGAPDDSQCDCGINTQAVLGNIYFSRYGEELGDVIEGSVNCTLSGHKNCQCEGEDTNGDGKPDLLCENAYLDVKFKVVVGSKFYFLQSGSTAEYPDGGVNLGK